MAKEKTHLVVLTDTKKNLIQLHNNDELVHSKKRGWIKAIDFKSGEKLIDNLGKTFTIDKVEHTNGIFHC